MAKKRKRQMLLEDGELLPHVPDERQPEKTQELSDEERRATEKVDSLIRDLFGDTAKPAGEADTDSPDEEAFGDGIVAESSQPSEQSENENEGERTVTGESVPEAVRALKEGNAPAEKQAPAEEEQLSFKEYIEASAEDFRLLMDMDYEDELGNAIGFERIRSYHEKGMNGRTSTRRRRRAERGTEFEKQSDEVPLRRAYARKQTGWIIHLAVSVLLLILMIIYERPGTFASMFGGPFDGAVYPNSYILLGVQLLLLDAALCYKPLFEGMRRLVRFSPVDYSFFAALLAGTLLYHVVLLFIPHSDYPVLYLSPAALCLTLLCGVELLHGFRESFTFDVISARRQKYALVERVSVGAKESSARERLLADEEEELAFYARPVSFVRNYFSNMAKRVENHRTLGAQLLLIAAIGVAMGLFALATEKTVEGVWRTMFASMLLCVPATSLLLTSLPMFFASLLRLRGRGAIVGEEPLLHCGSSACIVLPDHEIFASMQHEHLRLAQDCDAHRVSVVMHALLEKLQSPLAESFGVDDDSHMDPSALTLLEVEQEGVSAKIRDGNTVLMGTAAYLEAHGVAVDIRAEDTADWMHVAFNGSLAALFSVRYTLMDDVEPLLLELDRACVRLAVRSKDPCVREDVLKKLFPRLSRSAKVQKPTVKEIELRTDRVDASIVALESCKEVARTYIACYRVRRAGFWGRFLQALSVALGGFLAGIFTVLGNTPSAVTVTLWLLFWCAVYGTLSYLLLRLPSGDEE